MAPVVELQRSMAATIRYPLTIFYDASCRMCVAQVRRLKRRDAQGRLELVDCSSAQFDETVLAGLPLRRADLMAVIHARDAHGRWYSGVDVFELAYRAVGREAAAGIWANRALRPLLARLYARVARHRHAIPR
jgi:predicted DCC family thiol-disulfide oxidoreductase YuxK